MSTGGRNSTMRPELHFVTDSMTIRFDLDPELREQWLPILERQVDLTLAPLAGSLKSAKITFSTLEDEGAGELRYLCTLEGRRQDGSQLRFQARHRDGQTAIHDTAARARRAIVRSRQKRALGRMPSAVS